MLSDLEKKVIRSLQRDLTLEPQPFLEIAAKVGVTEEEVLAAIRGLMAQGYIRRFGATLRHQQSGFAANVLVAWAVPEAQVKTIGTRLAKSGGEPLLSRQRAPAWPYNLYTMIHGRTPEDCINIAARMAAETESVTTKCCSAKPN